MKLDPYKHKERYEKWKEKIKKDKYIPGISKVNSELIVQYILDMEIGINIAPGSAKGGRSHIRLNRIKQGMVFLSKMFETHYGTNLTDITDEQLIGFFARIRKGDIRKKDGGIYKSAVDFINVFKAFWHWWMKINKKKGLKIPDITEILFYPQKNSDKHRNQSQLPYLKEILI